MQYGAVLAAALFGAGGWSTPARYKFTLARSAFIDCVGSVVKGSPRGTRAIGLAWYAAA